MQATADLRDLFGSIDIYLFDQLLKGRFVPGMRVLDAGCGSGRNLVYFLRSGYDVCGVDESEEAIAQTRQMASALAQQLPAGTSRRLSDDSFRVELIEGRRYQLPDGSDRFLVDAAMLMRATESLGGDFLEPIKTVVVQNMRAMTTWVLRKR